MSSKDHEGRLSWDKISTTIVVLNSSRGEEEIHIQSLYCRVEPFHLGEMVEEIGRMQLVHVCLWWCSLRYSYCEANQKLRSFIDSVTEHTRTTGSSPEDQWHSQSNYEENMKLELLQY